MARFNNSYSRIVAWLKILLPLAALGIFSTLFLLARTVDPSQTLPIAGTGGGNLAEEQRIGAPNYSGVTSDGSAINLFAESARPDPKRPELVSLTKLQAKIETAGGNEIDIVAANGTVNTDVQEVTLDGGVLLTTADGYRIETQHLRALLDATELATDGPIVADGPLGRITAGDMTVTNTKDAQNGDDFLLVFKDGVKLVYTPQDN